MRNNQTSILITSHTMDYRDLGISSYNLACGLHRRDINVNILGPSGPLQQQLENERINFIPCPFFAHPELEMFKVDTLTAKLKNAQLDIIHNYSLSLHPIMSRVAKRLDIPYFLTIHTFSSDDHHVNTSFEQFELVIVPADAMREHVVNELDVEKEDVSIVPTGINLNNLTFHKVLQSTRKPVIGMSSPLVKENDIHLVPKIARQVLQQIENVHFLILGQGPLEEFLREKATNANIRQSFTFLDNPNLYYKMIGEIDILLHPEPRIGLGVRILEAMACGAPAVARRGGGIYQSTVDGETGILISPERSYEELSSKLLHLIHHPNKTRQLGTQGRKRVEDKFPLRSMIQEMIWHYDRVI